MEEPSDRELEKFPFRQQNKHTLNLHILSYFLTYKYELMLIVGASLRLASQYEP